MATKLSTGELNQENLMKDAMKFAAMMPGMFGNSEEKSMGKKNNGPDMSNMMGMMADLMSNNQDEMPNLNDLKNMSKTMGGKQKKGTKSGGINEAAYRKMQMRRKMQKKLEKDQ